MRLRIWGSGVSNLFGRANKIRYFSRVRLPRNWLGADHGQISAGNRRRMPCRDVQPSSWIRRNGSSSRADVAGTVMELLRRAGPRYASSLRSALASCRTSVSKPSVNLP
jgi:hypothetical protein